MSDTTKSNQSYAGDPKKDDNQQGNPQNDQTANNDFIVDIDGLEIVSEDAQTSTPSIQAEKNEIEEKIEQTQEDINFTTESPTQADSNDEIQDETELDIQSLKIDEEELKEAEDMNIDELNIDVNQEVLNNDNQISDLGDILIKETQTTETTQDETISKIENINLDENMNQENETTPKLDLDNFDISQENIQETTDNTTLSEDMINIAQTSAEDMDQEIESTSQEEIISTELQDTNELTTETTEITQDDLNIQATDTQTTETTQETTAQQIINTELQDTIAEKNESNDFSFNLGEQTQEATAQEPEKVVEEQHTERSSIFQNTEEKIEQTEQNTTQTKTQNSSFSFDLSELSSEEASAPIPTPTVETKKVIPEKSVEAINIVSDIKNKNEMSLSEIDIKSIKNEHAKKESPKKSKSLVFAILLIVVLGPLGYFVLAFMYPMSFPLPWNTNISANITNNHSDYVEQETPEEQTQGGNEYTEQLNLLQQQAKDDIKKAKEINNKDVLKYATSAYTKTSSLLENLENGEEIDIQKLEKEIETIQKYLDMAEKNLNE